MPLELNSQLGPYQILSPLGAGGMGEVYRAKDARLDREVAIKVLPDSFATDPERVARFQREAKVLASLNHPNIATIHGFEECDGNHLLVMELVEGETLAERLVIGPVETTDTLEFVRQIAEGLEAAHDSGIIHRDLKPANIKITPQGRVKVLDFGLAKATAAREVGSRTELANSPTITAQHTKPGTIMGTMAYMSPEQARGKPLDKRTDIGSLGCVLYECLTGQKPFDGETSTDVLAQIVTSEPDYSRLPTATPDMVVELIRRCLEKNAQQRLRDVGEVRVAMERLQADPNLATAGMATRAARETWAVSRLMPWSIVGILLIGLVLLVPRLRSVSSTPAAAVTRMELRLPEGAQVGWRGDASGWGKVGYSSMIAVSPDGARIAYAVQDQDRAQLFLREMDELNGVPIAGTDTGRAPFFSPDGRWMGFLSDNDLEKVAIGGGAPQKICPIISTSFGAVWLPDGKTIVFSTDAGLWSVSADGGSPKQLTQPDASRGEVGHHFPQVSPDGRHIVFTVAMTPDTHMAWLSLETLEWEIVAKHMSEARYLPSGHVVFARSGELLVAPYDMQNPAKIGTAVPLILNVHTTPGMGGVVVTHFSVSDTGTIVYVPDKPQTQDHALVWVDAHGTEEIVTQGPGIWMHPRLAPDGQRILFDIQTSDGMRDAYIYDLQRSQRNRLTHDGLCLDAEWSPDGTWVAYTSYLPTGNNIFSVAADFSDSPQPMLPPEPGQHRHNCGWTPDGKTLLFYERSSGGIWLLPVEGDKVPKKLLATAANERWPRISPNGQWMVYVADESGRREVFVQAFPNLGARRRISIDGGGEPVWSRDGSQLFFRQAGQIFVVEIEYEPEFRASRPKSLIAAAKYDAASIGHQHYDVSLDGKKFLMIKHGKVTGPDRLHVVLNWFEELKAKVPVSPDA